MNKMIIISKKLIIVMMAIGLMVIILFQSSLQEVFIKHDKINLKSDSPIESSVELKIAPLKLGDKSIEFPYTDENNEESLIIKSDKQSYAGFSDSEVYFSVTNTSDINETVVLLFHFPSAYIPTSREEPSGVGPATIASVEQRQGNQWQKLKFFSKNIKIDDNLLGKAISKRKSIPNDFAMKAGTQITITAGQTLYFRSRISFPPGNDGEFWIESLGKNGGYGLLDPFYSSSWTYRKKITIDHFKVSGGSNLSNFPVMFSVVDSNLATTANGGKAASGSGEFVFTSADGTTVLPHEIETYSATTGQFIGWVNVTTLSATADTYLYIYYGGPSSGATNQNPTGVWDSDFKGVWHLKETMVDEGTTGINKDSTSNVNSGTQTGNDDAAGRIDGGQDFDGVNDYVDMGTPSSLDFNTSAITLSAWVKFDLNDATTEGIISKGANALGSPQYFIRRQTNNVIRFTVKTTSGEVNYTTGSLVPALNTSDWFHIVGVYDGSAMRVYVNSVVQASPASQTGTISSNTINVVIGSGHQAGAVSIPFNGKIDEARISSIARSAGWIATEYNNQISPQTFASFGGAEVNIRTIAGIKYGTSTSTDSVASWFASGSFQWTNRKKVTIDYKKVIGGSNLSNFPVLISVIDSNLATIANGGKAASGSGEFVFTSADGMTVLPHEIETYSPTTGQFVGWVNVSTLSASTDTSLYIYYGGPVAGTKTNQRVPETWNSNYAGVWHLGETVADEGTASNVYRDSTANNNHGTQAGPDDITGKIGTAQRFDGTNDYINMGDPASGVLDRPINTANTISYWVIRSAAGGEVWPLSKTNGFDTAGYSLQITGSNLVGNFYIARGNNAEYISAVTTTNGGVLDLSRWYYLTGTYTGSSTAAGLDIYINGINQTTTDTNSGTISTINPYTEPFYLGARAAGTARILSGQIDEARVSSVVRTAGWINTEYNNQFQPSTFYSIGGQEARVPTNPGLKIKGGVKFR